MFVLSFHAQVEGSLSLLHTLTTMSWPSRPANSLNGTGIGGRLPFVAPCGAAFGTNELTCGRVPLCKTQDTTMRGPKTITLWRLFVRLILQWHAWVV